LAFFFKVLSGDQYSPSFLFIQEGLVPITVFEFSNLSLIPAGNFGEIARDTGDPIDVPRPTVSTSRSKASARPMAEVTSGEFGREGDLVIVSLLESLHHKIGE
jgi:hypothetical protein